VLKHALTTAPLLRPPNYNKDFLLYLAAAESTINTVLVQEDDLFSEYVIYYLSRGLVGPELNYSHIEKLALASIPCFSMVPSLCSVLQDHRHRYCESISIRVDTMGNRKEYQ
jgi:hypothetical protein